MTSAERVISLPRGGAVVVTSAGPVQFGAPPETLKDALTAGMPVPSTYVLPQTWFSRRRGVTVAELEFPVYYNYFLQGRRVTAVCDEAGRARLLTVLRESLFGPARVDDNLDYEAHVPREHRADLLRESAWFRRKTGVAGRHIELDEVIAFALYDEQGVARVGADVEIERLPGARGWLLRDRGELVTEVDGSSLEREREEVVPAQPPAGAGFTPPPFGLTVLGSSHGFDPAGKTTGFVLWINHRGILVDPPPGSNRVLAAAGVPARLVDAVILTHCHADHDAGVFQKILEEGRVSLFTTPTILGSFLRKYVALTGESEERLRRLFVFRPVTIGGPLRIHGAELRFFYTFHSIPTIGFEAYFGGKSFIYSADTLYDPRRIAELHSDGLITPERRDALTNFPWHHSLVLHEAGVPPIHTPASLLAQLPDDVKRRLRIIHTAESDLPAGSGLKLARVGFDETIVLPVPEPEYGEALQALDALAAVDLFRDFTVERCREFLTIARRETFAAGSLIIGQGQAGDRFYIIVSGDVVVTKDGSVLKSYGEGDFFGETALLTGAPRSADVRALTDLVTFTVDKLDFLSFLRGTALAEALVRLARNRDLPSWDLIGENEVLRALGGKQRTRLQAFLVHCPLTTGQSLWAEGEVPTAGWLIDDALVELREGGHATAVLGRGVFVGDVDAVLWRRPLRSQAIVSRGGMAFRLEATHMAEIVQEYPALLLALSGAAFA